MSNSMDATLELVGLHVSRLEFREADAVLYERQKHLEELLIETVSLREKSAKLIGKTIAELDAERGL